MLMSALPSRNMAAATHVMNLPELLESILLRIDNQTLILSQRVNKQFQATITSSVSLQEKLFFRKPRALTSPESSDREVVNPLLPWWQTFSEDLARQSCHEEEADKRFGFWVEAAAFHGHYARVEGTTTWFVKLHVKTPKPSTLVDSWRRMHIFREGHLVKHVSYVWRGQLIGEKLQTLRIGSESADVEAGRRPWMSTLGEVVDAAVACSKIRYGLKTQPRHTLPLERPMSY